jgi:5S rRNA maturation endonuclease (ribonuclease M5)
MREADPRAVNSAQFTLSFWTPVVSVEDEEKRIRVGKALKLISGHLVLVEGKKDKSALEGLGFDRVIALSGRTRRIREIFSAYTDDRMVYVLTDLDRRGEQLARIAREELEAVSMHADIDARRELGYLLNIRYFEDAGRKYRKLMEEGE